MRSKTVRQDEEPTLLGRVYERGEETVGQFLDDLFGRRGVVRQLRETADRASEARRRLDRNLQFLLKVLNVPSRADYDRLLARIDGLQGSLLNVSMKLDRLMAMEAHRSASSPPPKRPAAAQRRRSTHAHVFDEGEADADT